MMNRFLLPVLLALLAWLVAAPQPLLAQTDPADSPAEPTALSVDAAGFDALDASWQAALAAVVAAEQHYLPGPAPYTLTAFDAYAGAGGEWALAVIVPSATVQAGWENLDLDQLVDVLLHRTPDGRIEGHVRTNPAFRSLAAAVPRELVDYSPRLAAGPSTQADSVIYLFPWTAGQTWWGGGGWHTGYGSNALDFGPFQADVAEGAVLAAAGGTLRMACTNDDQQRLLWIEHPDGERTGYLHLDRASVGAAVEDTQLVGQVVPQGAYLGTVYTGAAKIDGSCPASFPNCTFNTICGYGNAPHVHFVLPSRDVVIDGIPADAIGSGGAGDRFISSNRRQDAAPQPQPDTEPPSAVLTAPISGSVALTPTAAAVVPVELAVTDAGGSGVAEVRVQLAWQNAAEEWIATDWVTATAAADGVYTAAFAACSPAWRVPHNRPLRAALNLVDGAGNRAQIEDAGSFRYSFPDLNADCIVEIKDLLDLLPALVDNTEARPEHDVNGDGSLDAADAAALLAAVVGGWDQDGAPNEGGGMRYVTNVTNAAQGFPGLGSRVMFTELAAPAGLDSARDVALIGSTALVADWRGGSLALVDVAQPLSAAIKGRLPLSDRVYGVTAVGSDAGAAAGSLAYVSDPQEPGADHLAVLDLGDPLTPTLTATLALPGEVMESALVSDRLYVAAGYAGLHVLDVSTPQTPTLLATLDTPGIATDVSVTGDIVYVADQENGLLIYQSQTVTSTAPITHSPTHPLTFSLPATYDTPGAAIGVTAAMSTVYVADGLGGVHILDAADPAAPRLLATYTTTSAANSVVISGTTVFVAAGWQGVLALDVSDPAAPYLAGSFDTPGYSHDLALAGDLLLVADGPAGLQLLRVEQQAAAEHYLLIPFVAK